MRRIGIDQVLGEVYESFGNYWRIKLPPPMITGATLDPTLPFEFGANPQITYIFREDDFDFTARIRRGRFYVPAPGQRPSPQLVLPRLAGDTIEGRFEKSLFVYDEYHLSPSARRPKLVALGSSESLWQVALPPERISTGELLFVLKARHNFGLLPEIDPTRLPENGRGQVGETLEALTDAAHRAPPGLIIESARAAAQSCLGTWAAWKFEDSLLRQLDLGPLIKKIGEAKRGATRAAEVIRILHPRVKPNEQEKYQSRPPMEDDAELAVRAVAFIIRELGWASE
jgi:hypothetical protein